MTAEHEPMENSTFTWKRKRYFDGKTCGLKDCTRAPDGYICDKKPTKDAVNGQLWFGPACQKCVDKTHPGLKPTTLAELAHQRAGASDLALVLDVEVGDVLGRLREAGLDERGVSSAVAISTPANVAGSAVLIEPVVIPAIRLSAQYADAQAVLDRLQLFHVVDQQTMDAAAAMTKMVKQTWNEIDEARKAIARPLQAKIKEIQAYFNPPLDLLLKAETLLKQKTAEGLQRAQAAQAAALQAAQQAHMQGNVQATALAAQAASQADVALPRGVSMRAVVKWAITHPMSVPLELWSPDPQKIQAAVDAGHRQIPGVHIWEENSVAVRVG